MNYSVLTPFIIPPDLRSSKARNIGDGLIFRAVKRALAPAKAEFIHTTRSAPGAEAIERINATSALVLAGANQLNDRFSVFPGFTSESLRAIRVPIVPMGIGLHGQAGFNDGMSENTRTILRGLHAKLRYSSWRCPATVRYLVESLPELATQLLMTGCPVIFDTPLLDGRPFTHGDGLVIVTVTERDQFWDREMRTLEFVAKRYPASERVLTLHQWFGASSRQPLSREVGSATVDGTPEALRAHAHRLGFRVVYPESVEECLALYERADAHFGSRLHAHLYFLSRAKRSFLSYVDERCRGVAEAFDFPVCKADDWGSHLGFDFERVRVRAREHHSTMRRFIGAAFPGLSHNCAEQLAGPWQERTTIATEFFGQISATRPGHAWRVAEFGCGNQRLRLTLQSGTPALEYVGYDIQPQTPDTVSIDLNRELPDVRFDVVLALGLPEYLDDPARFLVWVGSHSRAAILSYTVADRGHYTPEQVCARGWKHHWDSRTLERLASAAGLRVEASREIDDGRTRIWRFTRA